MLRTTTYMMLWTGFSVWTEKIRGLGSIWFFVMPNLHGIRPDGRPFRGAVIQLSYWTAISWDGFVIRHATSHSKPNGVDGMRDGDAGFFPRNHLFGTFTAAKERVIKVGRALSNATAKANSWHSPLVIRTRALRQLRMSQKETGAKGRNKDERS